MSELFSDLPILSFILVTSTGRHFDLLSDWYKPLTHARCNLNTKEAQKIEKSQEIKCRLFEGFLSFFSLFFFWILFAEKKQNQA